MEQLKQHMGALLVGFISTIGGSLITVNALGIHIEYLRGDVEQVEEKLVKIDDRVRNLEMKRNFRI